MNPKLKTQNSKLKTISCSVLCLLVAVSGCQPAQQAIIGDSTVTIIEAESFPNHMVGVWRNDEYGWIFMFDDDGYINRMTHTIGRANLRTGETSTFPLIEGGSGVVKPGLWHVEYNGQSSKLAVEIVLDTFSYRLSGNELRGSSRDIFIGSVPRSGSALWRAHWISYPSYVATTASGQYTDHELAAIPGHEDRGEIDFIKLNLDDLR